MLTPELKTCPFCEGTPTFEFRMDDKPTSTGHIGHYGVMKGCCPVIGNRTELFFTKPGEPANPELWEGMCLRMVRAWNDRQPDPRLSELRWDLTQTSAMYLRTSPRNYDHDLGKRNYADHLLRLLDGGTTHD